MENLKTINEEEICFEEDQKDFDSYLKFRMLIK